MKKLNFDWIVGFFEGEGSAGFYYSNRKSWNKKRYLRGYLSATISQADERIIRRIQKFFGYGYISHTQPRKQTKKHMWHWQAHYNKAEKFLSRILPYLQIGKRKKQVQTALKAHKTYARV